MVPDMLRRQIMPVHPMSFLAGDSEMARRIREHNWIDYPFGPPQDWPQSLRSAVSICLQSAFPTAIYWGSELRLLYNDAWALIPGPRHPAALGAPAEQVWSDIWHVIEPQFSNVIATGEGLFVEDQMLPMRRFGLLEETYWNYSFTPIRGEEGSIVGIFNSGHETTQQVLSRREMSFLLELGEAFRSSPDLRASRHAALKMLGEHLKVDRVGLRELRAQENEELAIVDEWTVAGVATVGPDISMSDFGMWATERLKAGHVLKVGDIRKDPNLGEAREIFASLGVQAAIAIPWMEQGRLVAVLFVHSREPRAWTDFDVSTTEKVLERTMAWMERERTAERERIMMREIDHRSRNVLAVVRSVVRQTLADDTEAFREKIDDRIAALARTHDLLSAGRWQSIELGLLLRDELSPYTSDDSERVTLDGPHVPLRSEQAQTIALMLHELATNAAKYGALSVASGRLDVRWRIDTNGFLEIKWNETVPSAKMPANHGLQKGFGSTLLDAVVNHDAGGKWTRSFDRGGLRCRLLIPLLGGATKVVAASRPDSAARASGRKTIFIVEDEPVLAMDLANMIQEFGYDLFGTAASVESGLSAIEEATPDAAILDANLSGQSSTPIAEALLARGVPVILASGYSLLTDLPDSLKDAPRLQKPIAPADLAKALSETMK